MDRKHEEGGGGPGPDQDVRLASIFMRHRSLKGYRAERERM